MRIENTVRSNATVSRSGGSRGTAGGFQVDTATQAARSSATTPLAPTSGIEALLALQAAEDPLLAKKKAVRRGNAMLDTLESIRADLLVGRVSEGRLNQLMVLVTQARQRDLPDLDALLDDIELRARVELAKFGRYPGA